MIAHTRQPLNRFTQQAGLGGLRRAVETMNVEKMKGIRHLARDSQNRKYSG